MSSKAQAVQRPMERILQTPIIKWRLAGSPQSGAQRLMEGILQMPLGVGGLQLAPTSARTPQSHILRTPLRVEGRESMSTGTRTPHPLFR